MEHFVTLFNRLYLPQGLALHRSMERHLPNYMLWILCVDLETFDVLQRLDLPHVRLLNLSDLETEELLVLRSQRTIGEYCWTLTPFTPRFVFDADGSVERVTYLDADLWFRKHPKPILDEFEASGKHVLITDHAYAPEYDYSATSGQYCVQFMTFTRLGSEPVRSWWEERCREWCFARVEEGRFGDQKYLDDWPERFASLVHVLQDKERALGPWNAVRFPYGNAIFYHFHALKILSNRILDIGPYAIPSTLKRNVYAPYFEDLSWAIQQLEALSFAWSPQASYPHFFRRSYHGLKRLFRAIRGPISTPYMRR